LQRHGQFGIQPSNCKTCQENFENPFLEDGETEALGDGAQDFAQHSAGSSLTLQNADVNTAAVEEREADELGSQTKKPKYRHETADQRMARFEK
jgi:hypothetical protein